MAQTTPPTPDNLTLEAVRDFIVPLIDHLDYSLSMWKSTDRMQVTVGAPHKLVCKYFYDRNQGRIVMTHYVDGKLQQHEFRAVQWEYPTEAYIKTVSQIMLTEHPYNGFKTYVSTEAMGKGLHYCKGNSELVATIIKRGSFYHVRRAGRKGNIPPRGGLTLSEARAYVKHWHGNVAKEEDDE
jgi:hypothetical protein